MPKSSAFSKHELFRAISRLDIEGTQTLLDHHPDLIHETEAGIGVLVAFFLREMPNDYTPEKEAIMIVEESRMEALLLGRGARIKDQHRRSDTPSTWGLLGDIVHECFSRVDGEDAPPLHQAQRLAKWVAHLEPADRISGFQAIFHAWAKALTDRHPVSHEIATLGEAILNDLFSYPEIKAFGPVESVTDACPGRAWVDDRLQAMERKTQIESIPQGRGSRSRVRG